MPSSPFTSEAERQRAREAACNALSSWKTWDSFEEAFDRLYPVVDAPTRPAPGRAEVERAVEEFKDCVTDEATPGHDGDVYSRLTAARARLLALVAEPQGAVDGIIIGVTTDDSPAAIGVSLSRRGHGFTLGTRVRFCRVEGAE